MQQTMNKLPKWTLHYIYEDPASNSLSFYFSLVVCFIKKIADITSNEKGFCFIFVWIWLLKKTGYFISNKFESHFLGK